MQFDVDTTQSVPASQPPPLAHAYIPLPAELISYCELNRHLASFEAEAWLFIYLDGASHQSFTLQAVRAEDIPAVCAASLNPWHQEGWRALSLVDVTRQVMPSDYPRQALDALRLRRQYLHQQLAFLNQQIAAQCEAMGQTDVPFTASPDT